MSRLQVWLPPKDDVLAPGEFNHGTAGPVLFDFSSAPATVGGFDSASCTADISWGGGSAFYMEGCKRLCFLFFLFFRAGVLADDTSLIGVSCTKADEQEDVTEQRNRQIKTAAKQSRIRRTPLFVTKSSPSINLRRQGSSSLP